MEVKCVKEGGEAAIACRGKQREEQGTAERKGFLEELAKAFREMHCLFQTENVLSTEYLVNLKSEYFLLILFDRETRSLGRN